MIGVFKNFKTKIRTVYLLSIYRINIYIVKFLKCYQTKITLLSYSAIFFICLEKVDMIRVVAIVAQVSNPWASCLFVFLLARLQ